MTIQLTCPCGNSLQTRAAYAGRRMLCPVCGQQLTVPTAEAGAAAAPAPPPARPAAAPAAVSFACACGRPFQARPEDVGRRLTCPDCGQRLAIPGPEQPPPEVKAEPAPPARARRWAVWGAAATVLVIAAGGAAWQFWPQKPPDGQPVMPGSMRLSGLMARAPGGVAVQVGPRAGITAQARALDLVPPHGAAFVSVRLADWWNAPHGLKLQKELADRTTDFWTEFERAFGLLPGEVEQLILVLRDAEHSEPCFLVSTQRPFELTRVAEALAPDGREAIRASNLSVLSGSRGLAVRYVHDRVFLAGPSDAVLRLAGQPPLGEGPLSPALRQAAEKHLVVAAFNPRATALGRLREGLPLELRPLSPLFEAESVTLVAGGTTDLEAEITLTFPDETEAGAASDVARTGLDEALRALAQWQKEQGLKAAPVLPLLHALAALMRSASIERRGADLLVRCRTEGDTLRQLAGLLPLLLREFQERYPRPPGSGPLAPPAQPRAPHPSGP